MSAETPQASINNEPEVLRIWELRDSPGVFKLWVGFSTSDTSAIRVFKGAISPSSTTSAAASGTTIAASATGTASLAAPVRRRAVENYIYERAVGDIGVLDALGVSYWTVDLLAPMPTNGLLFLRYDVSEFANPEEIVFG